MEVQKRFRVLRVIATLVKVLAVIVLVLGVLFGLISMAAGAVGGLSGQANSPFAPMMGGVFGGAGIILVALFYALILYAYGDFIYLALDVEENTRATASLLRELRPTLSAPRSAPVNVGEPLIPPPSTS